MAIRFRTEGQSRAKAPEAGQASPKEERHTASQEDLKDSRRISLKFRAERLKILFLQSADRGEKIKTVTG